MTHKDGMGREVGRGFRMGNMCIPVADSCWYMAKPIQHCKVKKKKRNIVDMQYYVLGVQQNDSQFLKFIF